MVTISKNQNAEQAFNYYFQENNYQDNSSQGYIFGEGLKFLKIVKGKKIEREMYYFLLHGLNPQSKVKLVHNACSDSRRAGIDITMSAPKSFSLIIEKLQSNNKLEDAQELLDAHLSANHRTMQKIENHFLRTRVLGKKVKTDNFIYASFSHDCSREFDPQVHTHNFIFNLTCFENKKDDIKILSLSNELIFKNKMYLGQFYRNELNNNLRKLGYETFVSNKKEGFFEIKGITKEQREVFSSRTSTINKDLFEKLDDLKMILPDANIYKLKDSIKLKSRPIKNKIDRKKLRKINNERLTREGLTLELVLSLKRAVVKTKLDEQLVIVLVDNAVENLIKYKSAFSKEELSREIMELSLKDDLIEDDFIHKLTSCKSLIKIHDNLYSSHAVVNAEKYIIENIYENVAKLDKDTKKVSFYCDKNGIALTKFQQNMVDTIISSSRRFISIIKNKKSGKKFVLSILDSVYERKCQFYYVNQKEDTAQNNTMTTEQYLSEQKNKKQRIICMHDSDTIASILFCKLIKFAHKNNDRIIFLGNEKYIKPNKTAEDIFFQAQNFGMEIIGTNESHYTKKDNISVDFKMLIERVELLESQGCLIELEKRESIKEILYNHLKNKRLLTTTKLDYKALNRSVMFYRELWGDYYELLEKHKISDDKYNTKAYTVKSVLVLHNIPSFRKSERVVLERIIGEKNLVVKTRDDKLKSLDISKYANNIEVYLPVRKMLYENEDIVFTKTIQDMKSGLRVTEGTVATVLKTEGYKITVELNHGRFKTFNIKDVPFVDYAFALMKVNPNKRASKTVIIADTHMSSLPLLCEHLQKIKNELLVYTTDIKELKQNIEKLHQEQIISDILMIKQSVITNKKRDKNEYRDYTKVESDREKSNGFNDETNGVREEHEWNIYDIGKHVKRATRRIRNYILFRRDYKLAREYAKKLEWYQRACLSDKQENIQQKEAYSNVKDGQKEEEIESLQNEIFLM